MFVGHTRFSLYQPRSTAWQASNGSRFSDSTEYKRHLFSDRRLEPRTRIFLEYTLPLLAKATSRYHVQHIISYSSELPPEYENALKNAAREFPFLILDKCSENQPPLTSGDYVSRIQRRGESMIFGSYRLDDDDVLPLTYFKQMERYLRPEYRGMNVSLGAGLTALYVDGEFYNARRCYHPMLGLGLLDVCQISATGKITAPRPIAHSRSDRANPVILDSRELGYLWVRHPLQDTALTASSLNQEQLLERARKHMNIHPPAADREEIHKHFGTFSSRIHTRPSPDSVDITPAQPTNIASKKPLKYSFSKVSGEVRLQIELECTGPVVERNALVSFSFIDNLNRPIDPKTWKDVFKPLGISVSGNSQIGFFRYLKTQSRRSKTRLHFTLPNDVRLASISIVQWREYRSHIKVVDMTIESSV